MSGDSGSRIKGCTKQDPVYVDPPVRDYRRDLFRRFHPPPEEWRPGLQHAGVHEVEQTYPVVRSDPLAGNM